MLKKILKMDIFSRYLFTNLYYYLSGKSIWQLVLEQFDDLLVKILLLAAIISFVSIHLSIFEILGLYHILCFN